LLVVLRLAGQTKPDTRNRLATRVRNPTSAFFTVRETLALGQFAAGALDGIFDGSVDLLLNRTVFRKSSSHCGTLDKALLSQL
jgi:hypothetical protein